VALALAVACAKGKPEPAALHLGEEACAQCRMLISERQYAAQAVSPGGSAVFFDDIGCLLRWMRAAPPAKGRVAFVVDFASGRWIDAPSATYLRSTRVPTPMRSGLVAFASRGPAEAKSAQLAGEVLAWKVLAPPDVWPPAHR
jgi:copper chaperone NosL